MATTTILVCDRCKKPETEAPGICAVVVTEGETQTWERDLCIPCRDDLGRFIGGAKLARTRAPK